MNYDMACKPTGSSCSTGRPSPASGSAQVIFARCVVIGLILKRVIVKYERFINDGVENHEEAQGHPEEGDNRAVDRDPAHMELEHSS